MSSTIRTGRAQATAGNPNQFFQADNVTFTNNTSNLTINIAAAVQPSSVTFNNDASHNYVINAAAVTALAEAEISPWAGLEASR